MRITHCIRLFLILIGHVNRYPSMKKETIYGVILTIINYFLWKVNSFLCRLLPNVFEEYLGGQPLPALTENILNYPNLLLIFVMIFLGLTLLSLKKPKYIQDAILVTLILGHSLDRNVLAKN